MRAALSALALLLLLACRPSPSPSPSPFSLSGSNALHEVRAFIALGPRVSGSTGAERAAAYLAGRLESLGLEAEVDTFEDATPSGPVTFRNVYGHRPGRGDTLIVLASHYDTKGGLAPDFVGANDSGSSTGLLLALAAVLREAHPRAGLLFAFVDGEECARRYGPHDGLHGSRRLAAAMKRDGRARHVRAVIVLDMVGDRDLSITLPRNGTPALTALVLKSARAEGVRPQFALAAGDILDDHVPFLEAGMPAVDIIDFAYGSAPGRNDYWHTPADTLDKLSPASLQTIGRVVLRMINDLLP